MSKNERNLEALNSRCWNIECDTAFDTSTDRWADAHPGRRPFPNRRLLFPFFSILKKPKKAAPEEKKGTDLHRPGRFWIMLL
jgi:hypothetical protein